MSFLKNASLKIINLPRFAKKTIAIVIDIGLCILCVWLAFYLRLEQFIKFNDKTIIAVLASIFLAIPIFWLFGLYKAMFRFVGSSIIFTVAIATLTYSLFYFSIIGIYVVQGVPRSVGIIQPLLLFLGISISRILIRNLFVSTFHSKIYKNKKNVLIYGAGSAGRLLLSSLENSPEMNMAGFLDDDKQFHNQIIFGYNVYNPLKIKKIIISKNIELVLLALPLIDRNKRNKIIENLTKYKIRVKTIPNIQDIVNGKISVSDIKDLTIEDLLSREQVKPNIDLLSKDIALRNVLVTGAGGSIGSELCRQIIKLKPKTLILLDLNEFALYKIREEIINKSPNLKTICLLANVQNSEKLNEVFKTFKIDTVYHTAAYKHVDLVEENICEGIKNNVYGTFQIAKIAIKYNVSKFVLVSSDKAVRPTNIMGASKRLAEICIQAFYHNQNISSDSKNKFTKFVIVRFGNVLQSSGSVIPKFKKQINKGGPITLTHPEITRYFMSVTEASQLVIQAGAMSESCEVFVLDMGESVRIKDIAVKMIRFSGFSVKDEINVDGDIEIKITGLRPGEKLFEELLIGNNPQKTIHEKIFKAQDPYILFDKLKLELDKLLVLLEKNQVAEVKEMLIKLIPTYRSNSKIVDNIYSEQLNLTNEIKTINFNQEENKLIKINSK
jgi:FlaA1/EpsC-like NDP-sugar epimerase